MKNRIIFIYIVLTEALFLLLFKYLKYFEKPNFKLQILFPNTGTNCEINFDDCASNPCDYGICKDGINRYDCVCKPGFTGKEKIENHTFAMRNESSLEMLTKTL